MKKVSVTLVKARELTAAVNIADGIEKIPSTVSYRIGRNADKVEGILKRYEKEEKRLIKEYGAQNEQGDIQVIETRKQEYFEAVEAFKETIVEDVELFEIPLSMFKIKDKDQEVELAIPPSFFKFYGDLITE